MELGQLQGVLPEALPPVRVRLQCRGLCRCVGQAVKAVQAAVSRAPFLLGQQLSLVDGVVWSALRSSHLHTPPTLTAWLARVNSAARSGDR